MLKTRIKKLLLSSILFAVLLNLINLSLSLFKKLQNFDILAGHLSILNIFK